MIPGERLRQIRERLAYVEARLADGASGGDIAALGREHAELVPVVERIAAWEALRAEIAETETMQRDAEMRALAEEELPRLRARLEAEEAALMRALLPRDRDDDRSAILEIRAGTGGEEAALFAADLFRMYQRYAEARGWTVELISEAPTELGGYREVVAALRGPGVFARLKWESGTHRVQRVPQTESGGRIHTSAATVAVLPEAAEVDVALDPADLRIDTMRASGAGGQHVNTTDSAVRITHLPSGIVVTASEKSQHQNRATALALLRAKLYEIERERAESERAATRRAQVGSGDRSGRIRTYNFPQGRLTDHRIGLTLYRLPEVMAGDLDEIIEALAAEDAARRLAEMER